MIDPIRKNRLHNAILGFVDRLQRGFIVHTAPAKIDELIDAALPAIAAAVVEQLRSELTDGARFPHHELIAAVSEMRRYQRSFYDRGQTSDFRAAREIEGRVDELLSKLLGARPAAVGELRPCECGRDEVQAPALVPVPPSEPQQ